MLKIIRNKTGEDIALKVGKAGKRQPAEEIHVHILGARTASPEVVISVFKNHVANDLILSPAVTAKLINTLGDAMAALPDP